jgi:hypothetical protein
VCEVVKSEKGRERNGVYIRMRLHVTRTSDAPSSFSGRLRAIEVLSENWVCGVSLKVRTYHALATTLDTTHTHPDNPEISADDACEAILRSPQLSTLRGVYR